MGMGSLSPGAKQLGHGVNHIPLSSANMKERVELYLLPVWACTFTLLMEFLTDAACYICKLSSHQTILPSPISTRVI